VTAISSKTSGMTLVELLIVFAILGLLVSLVGPAAYRQVERTRAQEEWLTLGRAVRDLAFESYMSGRQTRVQFSGTKMQWSAEPGVSRQLLFEHIFFDPSLSIMISESGVYDRSAVTVIQRGRRRELSLNSWVEFGRAP
jgi:prepilin-type N-terminal cleavage/methylation domain-containing protein